jgi:DNA polymerase III subunit delta'
MSSASLLAAPMPPWLAGATANLKRAHAAGRVPQALLIHEAPGAGGEWLALWAAQLVLCLHPERAPCGSCTGCRRVAAFAHPDLTWVGLTEDSKQLRIDEVRALSAELALTSHAGGYKVGILSPADALNRFAANALLKTLEEPSARTLLMLVATHPSRLPATVLSRCQRVRVSAPSREEALAWLTAARGEGDWNAALDTLGEAPLLAALSDPAALAQLRTETREALDSLSKGGGDPVATAERWARSELALRLQGFENWLTERIRGGIGQGGFLTEVRAGPYLSDPASFLNIRELFGLIDEVREMRANLEVPLNRGLALEALFRKITPRAAVRGGGRG